MQRCTAKPNAQSTRLVVSGRNIQMKKNLFNIFPHLLKKKKGGGGRGVGVETRFVSLLASWCFEPSQPLGIISGLKTNYSISKLLCSRHLTSNTIFLGRNQLIPHDTPAHTNIPPYEVWLQRVMQFRQYYRDMAQSFLEDSNLH